MRYLKLPPGLGLNPETPLVQKTVDDTKIVWKRDDSLQTNEMKLDMLPYFWVGTASFGPFKAIIIKITSTNSSVLKHLSFNICQKQFVKTASVENNPLALSDKLLNSIMLLCQTAHTLLPSPSLFGNCISRLSCRQNIIQNLIQNLIFSPNC